MVKPSSRCFLSINTWIYSPKHSNIFILVFCRRHIRHLEFGILGLIRVNNRLCVEIMLIPTKGRLLCLYRTYILCFLIIENSKIKILTAL